MEDQMNKKIQITVILATMLTLLSACSSNGNAALEATASAMVSATMTAEAANNAEIDAAVQATMTAIGPQATPVEVVELTEEELAALIDEAVAEAIAASEEAAAQTAAATTDSTVTEAEADNVTTVVVYAEDSLAYAEELVAYYYSLYEGYADEAVTTLNGIEAELAAISTNLQDIEDILNQGLETVNATIDQLNQAAADLSDRAGEAQVQAQTWMADFSAAQEAREETLLNMKADVEAIDRSEMVDMVNGFADEIRRAMGDGALNYQEKLEIAQSGANARAALDKFGGLQLQDWSLNIDALIGNAARGDLTTLRESFTGFSANLPGLESRR
jgi:DNA repair exonuclease SbcCD ATPase subunit